MEWKLAPNKGEEEMRFAPLRLPFRACYRADVGHREDGAQIRRVPPELCEGGHNVPSLDSRTKSPVGFLGCGHKQREESEEP